MRGRNVSAIPSLGTYERAAERERAVVPIRGRSVECKPLGNRRDSNARIHRRNDGAIVCYLYRTDVVTYYPDGRVVVRVNGWPSTVTANFITKLLSSRGVFVSRGGGRLWARGYPLADDNNVFLGDGYHLELQNPVLPVLHRVNRAGAKKVRNMYARFKSDMVGQLGVRNGIFYGEELNKLGGRVGHSELCKLMRSDSADDIYRAVMMIAKATMRSRYYFSSDTRIVSEAAALRIIDDAVKYAHANEYFEEYTYDCMDGPRKDRFEKYF